MIFLDLYKNLLPRARAWAITLAKPLRSLFEGLDLSAFKTFVDLVWLDIFPASTQQLAKWEDQWGLLPGNFTEQERRDRLDAAWKFVGGQDPRYIQDTLQANGFDVYVHEWWVPGTEPGVGVHRCVTPRNPFAYLREENVPVEYTVQCGEPLMQCGEADALCGNSNALIGYPLVNKVVDNDAPGVGYTVLAGEPLMQCGEPGALCGDGLLETQFKKYTIPTDPKKWPYFLYIGGENFPDLAQVDPSRQGEFEDLCLKICPAQQWLGILVEYN